MKLKLFLSIALLAMMVQMPVSAAISVDQTLSENYLRNNGYSEQLYDTVMLGRARALGEPYYGAKEAQYLKTRQPMRFFKRLYAYFDPAAEDYSFYHHDTTQEPSYTDL